MKTHQNAFKKLSLNKSDVSNLSKEVLEEIKGGGSVFSSPEYTCYMGTIQFTCTNQYRCTQGQECGMGIWPDI